MLTSGPLDRIAELQSLADNPKVFSQRRREILQAYMMSIGPERAQSLQNLQSQIENACAVAGSPPRAIEALIEMIQERTLMVEALHRDTKKR